MIDMVTFVVLMFAFLILVGVVAQVVDNRHAARRRMERRAEPPAYVIERFD
jgi:CHASE1-domain containing sensor protein